MQESIKSTALSHYKQKKVIAGKDIVAPILVIKREKFFSKNPPDCWWKISEISLDILKT